ncbi:hypothetical protein TNCV_2446521 [Trichonephila clavipes]|nr:hypothetical protein TNCV_2446521 [Trichonephila clavipes]
MLGKLQPRPLECFDNHLMAIPRKNHRSTNGFSFKSSIMSIEVMPRLERSSIRRNDENISQISRAIDGDNWPNFRGNEHVMEHFHENAPARTALTVQQFLANNIVLVPPPRYSTDLAPSDFCFCFHGCKEV